MWDSEYDIQQKEFLSFLKLLSDNDLLDHVMVAGSWAEFVYSQTGLLSGFDASLKTLDMDFLIKNLRRPARPVSLEMLASSAGYDVDHDVLYETTKIITNNNLEIEFLINQLGRGNSPVLKTNLGVNAQALRHMQIALNNAVTVSLFGMSVTVPKPEAYVLHKMVINEDRTKTKAEKDKNAVLNLAPFLDVEVYEEIYNSLTKNEQRAVDAFIQKYGDPFKSDINLLISRAKETAMRQNEEDVPVIPTDLEIV